MKLILGGYYSVLIVAINLFFAALNSGCAFL